MTTTRTNRSRLAAGIALAAALAVVGSLVWGLGQQVMLTHEMRVEETRLEQAVADEQVRNAYLLEQLEYVKSDEYVERWAREHVMARPGETAVVLLPGTDEELPAGIQPEAAPTGGQRSFWTRLWEALSGSSASP